MSDSAKAGGDRLLRSAGLNPSPAPEFKPVELRGEAVVEWGVFVKHRMWGVYYEAPLAPGLYRAVCHDERGREEGIYATFDDEQAARDWLTEWAEKKG